MPVISDCADAAPTALVFGASGQIGAPLLDLLREDGWRVCAVSRQAHDDLPGLHWRRGDCSDVRGLPESVRAIFSCGPLDLFGRWYEGTALRCTRVIAFGSTSIEVKRGSADAQERDVAARLQDGERRVFETAAERGVAATVLRPTLIYGAGRDRNLLRIARIARRFGRVVLPRDACGLRQPAHVSDLAAAAFRCIGAEPSFGKAYALPGGETLAYREMVARVLAAMNPPATLHEVPPFVFDVLLGLARVAGIARDFNPAAVARMREDVTFDAEPARRDFGYAPRGFWPTAEMFDSRDTD